MRIKIALLIVLAVFVGCQSHKTDKLLELIQKDIFNNKKVTISLSNYTTFKWDSCFVLNGAFSEEVIEKILKINYDGTATNSEDDLIIFINNSKIFYKEYFNDNNLPKIQFNKINDSDYVPYYNPQNSKFKVKIEETYNGSGKKFYNFVPIMDSSSTNNK